MKKVIAFVLSLVMCLSLCACGGKMTAEEMLAIAEEVDADVITLDIAGNKAKAKTYVGKTYLATGHIYEIGEDYCLVIARTVEGDNSKHVHSDEWYGYGCDTVFQVFLSAEELAELKLCDGIQFVGTIDEVGTREHYAIKDQLYLAFKNAYYVGDATYEGTYRG